MMNDLHPNYQKRAVTKVSDSVASVLAQGFHEGSAGKRLRQEARQRKRAAAAEVKSRQYREKERAKVREALNGRTNVSELCQA